jgi:hypothetical protein
MPSTNALVRKSTEHLVQPVANAIPNSAASRSLVPAFDMSPSEQCLRPVTLAQAAHKFPVEPEKKEGPST